MKKINVVIVGMGFGGFFPEIYKLHPDVASVGICDSDPEVLKAAASRFSICKTYSSLEAVLDDPSVDAVHLVTPIPYHEAQTVRVLEAGKHCACTVPMATTLEGIQRITQAVRRTGKKYMMMETTLYTYQFFYVKQLLESGEMGRIQFMRGSHYQDMSNWPSYWMGLPPMFYGTHAIAPMVALSGSRVCRVRCMGAGTMDPALHRQYGNPYPVECAQLEFENGLRGEATRSLFETARVYQEGMFIYGSKKSFEWGFADKDPGYVTTLETDCGEGRGLDSRVQVVEVPNPCMRLPEAIRPFTVGDTFDPLNPHESLSRGAGGAHHGSHPHLVHEFVRSILEDRKPWIDEVLGGNITAAGICAHASAMQDSEAVIVPQF